MKLTCKLKCCTLIILFLICQMEAAAFSSVPLGPFGGRNMYAPHLPWLSFPARSAQKKPLYSVEAETGIYLINEFASYPFTPEAEVIDSEGHFTPTRQAELQALDYESTVLEFRAGWQALKNWNFELTWYWHFRYGGFMDTFIEGWHAFLNVPNAGRQYFKQNQCRLNVHGYKTKGFEANGFLAASGDVDFKVSCNFWDTRKLQMAASAALKLPTGHVSGGLSSGFPDLGMAFLLDWRISPRWILYENAALILPMGPEGLPMAQLISAVEFRITEVLSAVAQFHLQSSPIKGDIWAFNRVFGKHRVFSLPQTDIKLAIKGRHGAFYWQAGVEEDPFTWEGPDILMYCSAGWLFR